MKEVSLDVMRRLQRQFSARFASLIDWNRFSIEAVVTAAAGRVKGKIYLHPFHWEQHGFSGLTLGWSGRDGPIFLVLYEQEAIDEHRLVIVLHELVHLLMGHCSANLAPAELRLALRQLGLIPEAVQPVVYSRLCLPRTDCVIVHAGEDEVVAELGAAWIVTRARQAGSLPSAGQVFTPEHVAISTLLGSLEAAWRRGRRRCDRLEGRSPLSSWQ